MKKGLIAIHISQWIPLLGFFLFLAVGLGRTGALKYFFLLIIPVGCLLMLVSIIRNLILALRMLAAGEFNPEVLRMAKQHKLLMTPFLYVSFGISMAPMALLNPWLIWLAPFAFLISFLVMGFAWLAMLATSSYVIAQVVLLWRQKTLTLKQGIIHIALQLLPVLDLAGNAYLKKKFTTPSPPETQP